jgi:hypothetical protein
MAFLTDRTLATGVTPNDLIHIVITGDTSQNPAGSSYKATLGQFINLFTPFSGGSGNCITDFYVTNIYGCSPITIQNSFQSTGSTSTGLLSFSFGQSNTSSGDYSFSNGGLNIASGNWSHSEGRTTESNGGYSHSEGINSISYGPYSHAEGDTTQSIGGSSHSEGSDTISIGTGSHSEGLGTITVGSFQHAQGQYNLTASTQSAFIIGNGTTSVNRSNLVFAAGNEFNIYGDLNVTGTVYSTGSTQFISTTGITTSAITLSSGITYNGINYLGNVDVTIPDPTNLTGLKLIIKDEGGNAGSYRIRITPSVGTIDGNSYVDMNINYMSLTLVARNNNWWLI